jgi:CHAD domain-containing protein
MARALPLQAVNPGGSLADNALVMLLTRLEELYRWAPFIADPTKVEELHAMRIAAKRLRYTMEIYAPVFETPAQAKEFDAVYDRVKSIQEQIGEIHDADVRGPLVQRFMDAHVAARPEIHVGLQELIAAQQVERARRYRDFIVYWNKLQKQGFRRRFLMLFAPDPALTTEETLPNEKTIP